MCELQFIYRKENLRKQDLNEFIKMLQFGSLNNSHATGLFNRHFILKNKGLVNLDLIKQHQKEILNDNFLIGHNRFKTNGSEDKNENNHPFILNSLVLVHNGIISNYRELENEFKFIKTEIETDSYIILRLINHFLKSNKLEDRIKGITTAIKKTCGKIKGSYSVFLYDKISNKIFYFKDNSTEFYIYKVGNNLIGTTTQIKINYIYENIHKVELNLKDNCIYLIENDLSFKKLDKFKPLKDYRDYYKNPYGDFNYTNFDKSFIDLNPFEKYDYAQETLIAFFNDNIETSLSDDLNFINIKTAYAQETLSQYFGYPIKENNLRVNIDILIEDLNSEIY
jgi:hypothetical protein